MNHLDCAPNLDYLKDLFGVLTPNVHEEHTAIHIRGTLEEDVKHYEALGWKLVKPIDRGTIAFMTRTSAGLTRVMELIPTNIPEHRAWVVPEEEEYGILLERFQTSPRFGTMQNVVNNSELRVALFRHLDTGLVEQTVWRKEPLVPDETV